MFGPFVFVYALYLFVSECSFPPSISLQNACIAPSLSLWYGMYTKLDEHDMGPWEDKEGEGEKERENNKDIDHALFCYRTMDQERARGRESAIAILPIGLSHPSFFAFDGEGSQAPIHSWWLDRCTISLFLHDRSLDFCPCVPKMPLPRREREWESRVEREVAPQVQDEQRAKEKKKGRMAVLALLCHWAAGSIDTILNPRTH